MIYRIQPSLTVTVILTILVFMPGCAKLRSYKQKPLRSLSSYITYEDEQDKVKLYAKQYDRQDCMQLFGSRGSRLVHHKHASSIYPIQISIKNTSDITWELNKHSVNLKLTPYYQVAHRIQNHTVLRMVSLVAIGAGVTALTAVGGVALLTLGMFTWSIPAAIAGGALCASVPFMLLVNTPLTTTINGIQSLRTNTQIKQDMRRKTLTKHIVIEPGQHLDTLLFVKGINYKPEFPITLFDTNDTNHRINFNVQLIAEVENGLDLLMTQTHPAPL